MLIKLFAIRIVARRSFGCDNKFKAVFADLPSLLWRSSVSFGDNEKNHIQTVNLKSLDTIALIDGGHGISFNSQTKFIEVKQGPYNEKTDKKRF